MDGFIVLENWYQTTLFPEFLDDYIVSHGAEPERTAYNLKRVIAILEVKTVDCGDPNLKFAYGLKSRWIASFTVPRIL